MIVDSRLYATRRIFWIAVLATVVLVLCQYWWLAIGGLPFNSIPLLLTFMIAASIAIAVSQGCRLRKIERARIARYSDWRHD